jgi:hypothetical protein
VRSYVNPGADRGTFSAMAKSPFKVDAARFTMSTPFLYNSQRKKAALQLTLMTRIEKVGGSLLEFDVHLMGLDYVLFRQRSGPKNM